MRLVRCFWFGALLLAACQRTPQEAVEQARTAIETRSTSELLEVLDPQYADTLGGKKQLLSDLEDLHDRFPRIRLVMEELTVAKGASELDATVVGTLNADFVGEPTWKVRGPVAIELVRSTDGFRIRSGLLTEFRDVAELMARRRAALEANDADAVRSLLHPRYRDGDLDADQAAARLARDLEGKKVRFEATNYRLELRGPRAHVDEHFVLTVNDRPTRPLIGRFTLERSAGRWRISSGLYPDDR